MFNKLTRPFWRRSEHLRTATINHGTVEPLTPNLPRHVRTSGFVSEMCKCLPDFPSSTSPTYQSSPGAPPVWTHSLWRAHWWSYSARGRASEPRHAEDKGRHLSLGGRVPTWPSGTPQSRIEEEAGRLGDADGKVLADTSVLSAGWSLADPVLRREPARQELNGATETPDSAMSSPWLPCLCSVSEMFHIIKQLFSFLRLSSTLHCSHHSQIP